ncbi:MAG: LD-carboxypeptidase [Treponema sp.]|nr:LD-carboxypeptidase [Treponema sp.]
MKYPKKLESGSVIGLVCPSSPVDYIREEKCKSFIQNLGYKIKVADNLTANHGGYMAGNGPARGKWLNTMFADPEVDAIFCIKGGSGGSRSMEFMDLQIIKKNPKIFLGYSDVTSHHIALNQICEMVTFHGPMVSSNMVDKFDEETKNSLFNALNAVEPYDFQNPKGAEIFTVRKGSARGVLTGGCLALLSASIGTFYEIDTKGKILFIEDVGEEVSRLERYAYHLRNSGKFKDSAGIILGTFENCKNSHMSNYSPVDCLIDIIGDIDVPILCNVQSGHCFPMMTLPFGADCSIDTSTKTIRFYPQR